MALAVLASGACVSKRTVFAPEDASVRTLVIVRVSGGAATEAIALDTPVSRSFWAGTGAGESIFVLAYTCPKGQLGFVLDGERLMLGGSGATGPLPPEHAVYELSDDASRLTVLQGRPPPIDAMRIAVVPPAPPPCAQVQVERVNLPQGERVSIWYAFALDSRRALLGGANASGETRFYVLTRTATGSSARRIIVDSTFPRVGEFRAEDGELWLLSGDGALIHGTFERGFTAGPPADFRGETAMWVDGRGAGPTVELLVVAGSGVVEVFRHGAWSALASDKTCPLPCAIGAVMRLGGSKYIFSRPGVDGAFLADAIQGTLVQRPLPDPGGSAVAFAVDPGGVIYASNAIVGAWSLVKSTNGGLDWTSVLSLPAPADAIVPFGGTVFFVVRGEIQHLTADPKSPCNVGGFNYRIATSTVVGGAMLFPSEGSLDPGAAFFATVVAPPGRPPDQPSCR